MATSSSSKQFINPKQPPIHSSIFRPLSNPASNPNPRPRGRKSGSGSGSGSGSSNNTTNSKNDTKDKPRRRGVGMAELERLRRLNDQHSSSPPPNDSRVNPTTLPGIPLIHYCIPGQPVLDPTLTLRVAGMPSESSSSYNELPSILNSFHFDHSPLVSFKKKRVIGEEVVGFAKGCNGNFNGYDLNNYNGDNNNNHYLAVNEGFSANTVPTTGSEIVAIHKKWSGSMMEYGFFPKKSEKSDSSASSSSSSLSSLTTATTTTNSIDLSLKLSSYY